MPIYFETQTSTWHADGCVDMNEETRAFFHSLLDEWLAANLRCPTIEDVECGHDDHLLFGVCTSSAIDTISTLNSETVSKSESRKNHALNTIEVAGVHSRDKRTA